MPAAGFIGPAIGAISSIFGAKGAMSSSSGQNRALDAQTAVAGQQADQGGSLFRQGMPQLKQAGNYFSTLASGNRAATTQALAPAVSNINSVYGGTARTLSRFLRGPERDTQMAEAERERAGQIGSLFRDAPATANANLAQMGDASTRAGVGATGNAGSLFGDIAKGQYNEGQTTRQAGQDFGGLLFNMLKLYSPKGPSQSVLPSRSTVPNVGFLPGSA